MQYKNNGIDDKTIKLIEQRSLEAYRKELLGELEGIWETNRLSYITIMYDHLNKLLYITESLLDERFPAWRDNLPLEAQK